MMRIHQDVERSFDNSNDTRLLFEAKTLSTDCEKRLNKLKSKIEKILAEFRMTPEGRVAREVKRNSVYIKSEAGLEIYKLPLAEVHQVNSGARIKAVVVENFTFMFAVGCSDLFPACGRSRLLKSC